MRRPAVRETPRAVDGFGVSTRVAPHAAALQGRHLVDDAAVHRPTREIRELLDVHRVARRFRTGVQNLTW